MKIKEKGKYKVIATFNHFEAIGDPSQSEGFELFEGEEYTVDFIYDMKGSCYVNLGVYKNQFGETKPRTVCIETFKNCFEESQL